MSMPVEASPKAQDLAYVWYQAPDLEKMKVFLADFGFEVSEGQTEDGTKALFSRGTDCTPYAHVVQEGPAKFVGVGFHMESEADFRALSEKSGASAIEPVSSVTGAKRIRFTDPNGYTIDGLIGFDCDAQPVSAPRQPLNTITDRARIGTPIRLEPGPARVNRLGHCVLFTYDFRESEAWYKERFGILTAHEIFAEEENNVIGAFFRCDRGDIPSDHHTLFLIGAGKSGASHVAFEVKDWDTVMLGHDHLSSKGYTPHWGIGKHILGSQVFDYWLDPFKNVLEHFTDGDVFDASEPATLEPIDKLLGVQWGPVKPTSDVEL
ncbi:MAG: VOC family protein [Pseudomonadota bacterium]